MELGRIIAMGNLVTDDAGYEPDMFMVDARELSNATVTDSLADAYEIAEFYERFGYTVAISPIYSSTY